MLGMAADALAAATAADGRYRGDAERGSWATVQAEGQHRSSTAEQPGASMLGSIIDVELALDRSKAATKARLLCLKWHTDMI